MLHGRVPGCRWRRTELHDGQNTPHTSGLDISNSWPCSLGWTYIQCHYDQPPTQTVNGAPGSDIATKVWGALENTCNYNGTALTIWTFGCNLGIKPALSTGRGRRPGERLELHHLHRSRCYTSILVCR